MHEDYDAETGDGLAPTVAQSPGGKFAGFVGWNLLAEDMLQCEVTQQHCMTLAIEKAHLKSTPLQLSQQSYLQRWSEAWVPHPFDVSVEWVGKHKLGPAVPWSRF